MSDELYKRLKLRREELGLTQEQLAQKMGYKSRSSINKIELGENDIPQSKIAAFAVALETTAAYLMGWETEEGLKETGSKSSITKEEREKQAYKALQDLLNGKDNTGYVLGMSGKNEMLELSEQEYRTVKAMLEALRKDGK